MMQFCKCAVDMSLRSTHSIHQHGAVIVKGKTVVATGYNNEYHHAEAKAIRQCVERVLQGSRGSKGSAKVEV